MEESKTLVKSNDIPTPTQDKNSHTSKPSQASQLKRKLRSQKRETLVQRILIHHPGRATMSVHSTAYAVKEEISKRGYTEFIDVNLECNDFEGSKKPAKPQTNGRLLRKTSPSLEQTIKEKLQEQGQILINVPNSSKKQVLSYPFYFALLTYPGEQIVFVDYEEDEKQNFATQKIIESAIKIRERAGIKPGDIILSYIGQENTSRTKSLSTGDSSTLLTKVLEQEKSILQKLDKKFKRTKKLQDETNKLDRGTADPKKDLENIRKLMTSYVETIEGMEDDCTRFEKERKTLIGEPSKETEIGNLTPVDPIKLITKVLPHRESIFEILDKKYREAAKIRSQIDELGISTKEVIPPTELTREKGLILKYFSTLEGLEDNWIRFEEEREELKTKTLENQEKVLPHLPGDVYQERAKENELYLSSSYKTLEENIVGYYFLMLANKAESQLLLELSSSFIRKRKELVAKERKKEDKNVTKVLEEIDRIEEECFPKEEIRDYVFQSAKRLWSILEEGGQEAFDNCPEYPYIEDIIRTNPTEESHPQLIKNFRVINLIQELFYSKKALECYAKARKTKLEEESKVPNFVSFWKRTEPQIRDLQTMVDIGLKAILSNEPLIKDSETPQVGAYY